MVQIHENIVGIDSAIFMHPDIWKASGHIDSFNDPMIDNKDSKKRYRADELIEDYLQKQEDKVAKEVEKAAKRFGDAFDEQQFITTNQRVVVYKKQIERCPSQNEPVIGNNDLDALRQVIIDCEIVDPVSGQETGRGQAV